MKLKKLFQKFRKKERLLYPEEYFIIDYNETALRNGIEDNSNKLIIRYKYDKRTGTLRIYRIYGYSDSLAYKLKNILRIPGYDKTLKERKLPVNFEINLDEVVYKR